MEKKPLYLVEDVLNLFGINELFNVVVVEISKVEELAARGFLCMSYIKKYRKVVDVKLKFFLMEITKEKAIFEFNERRLRMHRLILIFKRMLPKQL